MIFDALAFAVWIFSLFLLARVVLSFIQSLSPEWRPSGFGLVLVESVYFVTDPAVKAVRSVVKPIDLGGMRLDLAVFLLLIACWFVGTLLRGL